MPFGGADKTAARGRLRGGDRRVWKATARKEEAAGADTPARARCTPSPGGTVRFSTGADRRRTGGVLQLISSSAGSGTGQEAGGGARAGPGSGTWVGSPRCRRMRGITDACSISPTHSASEIGPRALPAPASSGRLGWRDHVSTTAAGSSGHSVGGSRYWDRAAPAAAPRAAAPAPRAADRHYRL
jgi:hypothetical protein